MKKALLLSFCILILAASSGAVMAQDYDYHPALSDNFSISLGWFKSDNAFKISAENLVDDAIPNDEINRHIHENRIHFLCRFYFR